MNKNRSYQSYQTEYSSSFNWDPVPNHVGDRSSSEILDRKVQKFRHRLKLALLEKLDKLESEYGLSPNQNTAPPSKISRHRKSNQTTTNHHGKSSRYVDPSRGTTNNHKSRKTKKINANCGPGYDELCRQELRRSRSLALEFKHKNESTQIWWINEPMQSDSEAESTWQEAHQTPVAKRWVKQNGPTREIPVSHDDRRRPERRRSFLINKPNALERSQSYSRSSCSHQKAQATGYQSTTDELSSFNHDTDGKSINGNPDGFGNNPNQFVHQYDIPKLHLPIISSDQDFSYMRPVLQFCSPYQKEDFIADISSCSSESDPVKPHTNFDTYRLD